MDCLTAQRVISEKLDREPVDAALLETAKDHCRTCAECGLYVRGLVTLGKATPPQPSSELHSRIMRAIEAEAPVVGGEPSGFVADGRESSDSDRGGAWQRLNRAINDPRNRTAVISWTVAAAAIFVAAGIGTINGIRQMSDPGGTDVASTRFAPEGGEAASSDSVAKESEEMSSQLAAPYGDNNASSPDFITVGSTVYRSIGPAPGSDIVGATRTGTTVSALGTGEPAKSRDVYTLGDPSRVYITDATGTTLGFDRVTRTVASRQYALQSAPLTDFGQWPSLPSGINRPTSPSGAPEYTGVGSDAAGVTIYGRGGSTSAGFLIAPATTSSDPAAANPDWTWWTPIQ
jgi:hypothetical protein